MRRNERRALLFGAVDLWRDEHAVPVDEFRGVGVVDDVDGDGLAFAHAQDGSGRSAVVADGGEDVRAGEFDGDRGDAEGVVCLAAGRGARWASDMAACSRAERSA